MRKCEYCGKTYVEATYKILKMDKIILVPACECLDTEYQRKECERAKQSHREILTKKFENSMITPYFKEKRFEKFDTAKEEIKFGIEYVKTFDPKITTGIRLLGDIGRGKTTLLACICNELINKGYNCLFMTMSELLDKFVSSYNFNSEENAESLFNWLVKFDVVVLDDLGRETYFLE